MIAKRISDMCEAGAPWLSFAAGGDDITDWPLGEDERPGAEVGRREYLFGRHFRTASMEARQGWTCSGMLNVTRITIAALPIVEATDGGSAHWVSKAESNQKLRLDLHIEMMFPLTLLPNVK